MPSVFRRCSRCCGEYPEQFFSIKRNGVGVSTPERRVVCVGCDQTRRDTVKRQYRWTAKARDSMRNHAKKYGLSLADMPNFGWDVERIAHELEHAYGNGCQNCGRPYGEMGHGLADVTIDIFDRTAEPFYGSNTRIICQTCNREKGKTTPGDYSARSHGWRLWEENEKKRKVDPYFGLPLFQQ